MTLTSYEELPQSQYLIIFGTTRTSKLEPLYLDDERRVIVCRKSENDWLIRSASPGCLKLPDSVLFAQTSFDDGRPLHVFKHEVWYE